MFWKNLSQYGATKTERFWLAMVSAILNGVAFIWFGSVSLVANVPLLLALRQSPTYAESARLGFIVGSLAGLHIYGIAHYGLFLLIGFSFYTGAMMVIFGLLFHRLWFGQKRYHQVFLPVSLWCATEWLRTQGNYAMPASYAGNMALEDTFEAWLFLLPWTGGLGLSAMIALAQSITFHALVDFRKYQKEIKFSVASLILAGLLGYLNPPPLGTEPIKVAGIQAGLHNVVYDIAKVDPIVENEIIETFARLTHQASADVPDMILWPETAIRTPWFERSKIKAKLIARIPPNTSLIAGMHRRDSVGLRNAAVNIESQRVIDEVFKRRLVPGTEGHFVPGASHRPLQTQHGEVGVMICLEAVYPEIARELSAKGASLLMVISNDAGFGKSPITNHMTRRAVIRAIENGKWLVRVGQAGLSVVVDPRGKIRSSLPLFTPQVLEVTVNRLTELTFYTRYPWICICLILLHLSMLFFGRITAKMGETRHQINTE